MAPSFKMEHNQFGPQRAIFLRIICLPRLSLDELFKLAFWELCIPRTTVMVLSVCINVCVDSRGKLQPHLQIRLSKWYYLGFIQS